MKFYHILITEGRQEEAAEFYISELRGIIKETKKRNFEKKNNYFINLLKNPTALKDRKIFEELSERFLFTFNKYLTSFLYNPGGVGNQSPSLMSLDEGSNQITDESVNDTIASSNVNMDAEPICNAEREIKDLSKLSTMDDYSDFEDELPCYQQDGASNDFPSAGPAGETNIGPTFKSNLFLTTEFGELIELNINQPQAIPHAFIPVNNLEVSTLPSTGTPDITSNYFQLHKPYVPNIKKQENIKDKYPLLNQFRPKYTKRENIDKKILRKFKAFLIAESKAKQLNMNYCDKNFWIMFISGNILPPLKYTDNNSGELVDFKSFNSNFMNWLFRKKGAEQFYNSFIAKEGDNTVNFLTDEYLIHKIEDINQLDYYVKNLYKIFTFKKNTAPQPIQDPFNDESLRVRLRERSREFDVDECNEIRFSGYRSDGSDE
jgi:hypothetical protein